MSMSRRLEDRIRDYLANNLDVLERGLTLVDTEYTLPSNVGAGGRIDIVARDICGHVLVIEIKRSDQSARQAITEICKYVALFRIDQGLDEKQVRLVVVSTDWHELLLPLSEFAEASKYSVDGYAITVSQDGIIEKCTKKATVSTGSALRICRLQSIYLFNNERHRDEFIPLLSEIARDYGIEDHLIFRCNYLMQNSTVIFPHAAYFCFSSPIPGLSADDASRLKARIEWDEELDEPDENFLVAINEDTRTNSDSFEIGYPEKLSTIATEWSVSIAIRAGRLAKGRSILSDEELIELAKFVHGGSPVYLQKITTPRFASPWHQFAADVEKLLPGSYHWQAMVPELLADIARKTPDAMVAAQFYLPANLPVSLYFLAIERPLSYFPYFEIIVDDEKSRSMRILEGFLVWSGGEVTRRMLEIIKEFFGGLDEWIVAVQFHSEFEKEDDLLRAHNLRYIVVEWSLSKNIKSGPTEIFLSENGSLFQKPFDEGSCRSLTDFAQAHPEYLRTLQRDLQSVIGGLPECLE
jgi:hypothetical protein